MDQDPGRVTAFVAELRRRRVVRVGISYAAVAFVVLQGADLAANAQLITEQAFRLLVLAGLVGFPIVLVLGWLFDLTPEGIRLATGGGGSRLVAARVKPWAVYATGVVVLAFGLALVVMVNAPRAASAEVAPGADVIAVLPFTTSGEGLDVLGEGMVDLLSRNLDEVGALRTVDSRTVLYRWEQRAAGRRYLPQDEALEIGREVQAGSVLTGSVVAVGPQVRLNADLLSTTGAQLASASLTGPASEVLALVDSLSVLLLQDIWRSSRPLPQFNVSAITSSNLEAIRAFLEGERHYRASDWDQALTAFARAVAADPLFPLAHYRIASTASWMRGTDGVDFGRKSAELAERYSDRLPTREQLLVHVEALRAAGRRAEAVDTLRAYLRRHSDDAEAWFALADDVYHLHDGHAGPARRALAEQLEYFDHALALDPNFTPALIHPLEIAFRAADSTLIRRYVGMLDRVSSTDRTGAAIYHAAEDALRGAPDPNRIGRALVTLAVTQDTAGDNLAYQAGVAVMPALIRAAALMSTDQRGVVLHALREQIDRSGPGVHHATTLLAALLTAVGRLAEAAALLDSPAAGIGLAGDDLLRFRSLPTLAGMTAVRDGPAAAPDPAGHLGPRVAAGQDGGTPAPTTSRIAFRMIAAIDRDDAAAVRQAAAHARALEDDDAGRGRALARLGEAFARVIEGDTVAGLQEVEAALDELPFVPQTYSEALWFRWLRPLAAHPPTRERAVAVLAGPWPGDPVYDVLRQLPLARALEATGESAAARDAYRRFADAFSEADPGLAIEFDIQDARARAERLADAPGAVG